MNDKKLNNIQYKIHPKSFSTKVITNTGRPNYNTDCTNITDLAVKTIELSSMYVKYK